MNTNHTPAPWTLGKLDSCYIEINAPRHAAFASVVYKMDGDDRSPECEANARLIAAAPELLEALKLIASCESRFAGDVVDIAKKAVLKATGEQA